MKKYPKICLFCSSPFEAKHKNGKFCQHSCYYSFISQNRSGENSPTWKEKAVLNCCICGKEFFVYPSAAKTRKCCSKKCKSEKDKTRVWSEELKEKMSESNKGENNPNFGKKWTQDKRDKMSAYRKSVMNDEMREKSGRANRGKKFDAERIRKLHGHRSRESYVREHSVETKLKIGKQSSERFLDENYKKNIVEKSLASKEASGKITRRENLDAWKFYWIEAGWLKGYSSMWPLAELGQEKLKEFGVFCPKTNIKGCVRDHIIGRKFGFDNGVYPELLRHPRNCQILTNRENNLPQYRNNSIEDIEILLDNISCYDKYWPEQELCLSLIQKYKNGERWVKNGISNQ